MSSAVLGECFLQPHLTAFKQGTHSVLRRVQPFTDLVDLQFLVIEIEEGAHLLLGQLLEAIHQQFLRLALADDLIGALVLALEHFLVDLGMLNLMAAAMVDRAVDGDAGKPCGEGGVAIRPPVAALVPHGGEYFLCYILRIMRVAHDFIGYAANAVDIAGGECLEGGLATARYLGKKDLVRAVHEHTSFAEVGLIAGVHCNIRANREQVRKTAIVQRMTMENLQILLFNTGKIYAIHGNSFTKYERSAVDRINFWSVVDRAINQQETTMKSQLLIATALTGLIALSACGPTEQEKRIAVRPATPAREIPLIDTNPTVQYADSQVNFVTGGVGEDERMEIEQVKGDYNVHVTQARSDGAFVEDINTIIRVKAGNEWKEILNVDSGPLLYVSLLPGTYTIESTRAGVDTKKKQFVVSSKGKTAPISFTWKPVVVTQ